jgi:Family of unknown function (DUF6152)
MKEKTVLWVAAIVTFACPSAVRGHHSMAMFDIANPMWIKGTVVRYEAVNPHARIALDQKAPDGSVHRWVVEGPNLNRLGRMNVGIDFLKAGDTIEICGFPFKGQTPIPDARGAARPAMHAHVLVMPDGKMRLFGPYGKLANCIRPNDSARLWVEFLDRDPLAREIWCRSGNDVSGSSRTPKAFVDEIDRLIANPCG